MGFNRLSPIASQRSEDADRIEAIRGRIRNKAGTRAFYQMAYRAFADCMTRTTGDGMVLEIGSGAGFIKDVIPEATTSDLYRYPWIDHVVDATSMPFASDTVRMVCALNVLHHISDASRFFSEVERCLSPGGRVCIIDHHRSVFSDLLIRYVHAEAFSPHALEWRLTAEMRAANTALLWIVFQRDRAKFQTLFPKLRVVGYQPHSSFLYWVSGGLRRWTLVPAVAANGSLWLDARMCERVPSTCCFARVELEKVS